MSAKPSSATTAVRLPDAPNRSAIDEFLASTGLRDTVEFLPKDDDELDTQARAGRFETIVYATLDDLLTAIWKGDADWGAWRQAGIRVVAADQADAGDWRDFVDLLWTSLARWRKSERRRQIIAGVILSALALGAAAILLWSARPG